MANYYASARSNYFRVKDLDAFKSALEPFQVEIHESNEGKVCLLSHADSGWDWYDPTTDENFDGCYVISPHLDDGEVCVLMESGAEKLCYVSGYAVAFNNEGREVTVSLSDIYALARNEFGEKASMTTAEY